jgi:cell division protease FtsH
MNAQAIYMYQNPNDPGRPRSPQRPGNGGNGNDTGGRGGSNGSSLLFRAVIFVVVAVIAYYLFMLFTQNNAGNANTIDIPYSLFIQQVKGDNVHDVTFQGQDGYGTLKKPVTVPGNSGKTSSHFHVTLLPSGDPNLTQLLIQHQVEFSAKPVANNDFLLLLANLLPWILLIGAFIFIARRATQSQQSIFSFGKSRAKMVLEDRPTTTFSDVAGVDEAKNDLVEVVEFLRTPQKFQRLGGKIPRGVL